MIEALLEDMMIEGPKGKSFEGLSLTCGDCDLCVECQGFDNRETRDKLVTMLNEQCPEHRCHRVKILTPI